MVQKRHISKIRIPNSDAGDAETAKKFRKCMSQLYERCACKNGDGGMLKGRLVVLINFAETWELSFGVEDNKANIRIDYANPRNIQRQ